MTQDRAPGAVQVTSVATDSRVADRLAEVFQARAVEDPASQPLVILPSRVRDTGAFYSLDEVAIFKEARAQGVSVVMPDRQARYLHEHSAGWVADVAVGVITEFTASGIAALTTLLWLHAKDALRRQTHTASLDSVPLKVTVTRQIPTPEGLRVDSIELIGAVADVVQSLPGVLERSSPSDAAQPPPTQPTAPDPVGGSEVRIDP